MQFEALGIEQAEGAKRDVLAKVDTHTEVAIAAQAQHGAVGGQIVDSEIGLCASMPSANGEGENAGYQECFNGDNDVYGSLYQEDAGRLGLVQGVVAKARPIAVRDLR